MEKVQFDINKIYQGNCVEVLKTFPDKSINCCITSPPYYGLRDYGTGKWVGGDPKCPHRRLSKQSDKTITGHAQEGLVANVGDAIYKTVCPLCGAVREDEQVGLEETPEEYIQRLVDIFKEVKRVLTDDGTLWLNIGDSYVGSGSRACNYDDFNHSQEWMQTASKGTMHNENIPKFNTQGVYKNKDMIGIPWMLAFALRADGWYLRQDIIWAKPNPMPESVTDRCTKSHEYIFLLSKSPKYYFDYKSIREVANYDGRKDTMLKGSPKYADGFYLSTGTTNSMATNGHQRWQVERTGIKMGGPKYTESEDEHYQTKSGNEWIPQQEEVGDDVVLVRNKRDVWNANSKYENVEQESSVRQGINHERGTNVVALRKNLPTQDEFVTFIKSRATVDELAEQTEIPRTTIEHWFRTDQSGFSYPSVEDWLEIRSILDDGSEEFDKINSGMTEVTYETDEVGKNSEGMANKRDVWRIPTSRFKGAHFATFPEELVLNCLLAGCPVGGTVLDPFMGSGTVGYVAKVNGRNYVGVELNPEYIDMATKRIQSYSKTYLW